MILDAIRESGGRAVAADDASMIKWMHLAGAEEGLSLCPEAAACLAGARAAVENRWIDPADRLVIFNTGAVQKYVEVMQSDVNLPHLDKNDVDWNEFASHIT